MAFTKINSHCEMIQILQSDTKNYVLLYKKGSEQSDCSYDEIAKTCDLLPEVNVLVADVGSVRDIHENYGIESVPALLVFEGKQFEKTIKGCNDKDYYKSIFERTLFTAKQPEQGKTQKRVTVYSTPSCSWCNTLKTHLKKNGIQFTDVDVSKDQNAAENMVRRSGQQGVPQTDISGEMIVGFDKTRINLLLGIN